MNSSVPPAAGSPTRSHHQRPSSKPTARGRSTPTKAPCSSAPPSQQPPQPGEFGDQEAWFARQPDGELVKIGPLEEEGLRSGPGHERDELGYLGLATGEEEVLATANLSHVVYYTKESYWKFDHTEVQGGVGFGALYEYAEANSAAPLMVGVKGGFDSHELVSTCATAVSTLPEGKGLARYVSESGRTVYFTALGRDAPGSDVRAVWRHRRRMSCGRVWMVKCRMGRIRC